MLDSEIALGSALGQFSVALCFRRKEFFLCAIIKFKVRLVYNPNCIFISSSQGWCLVFPSAYVFPCSALTQFKGLMVLPVKADI